MKTYPLLIPKNIILPISILGFIFTVIGTLQNSLIGVLEYLLQI